MVIDVTEKNWKQAGSDSPIFLTGCQTLAAIRSWNEGGGTNRKHRHTHKHTHNVVLPNRRLRNDQHLIVDVVVELHPTGHPSRWVPTDSSHSRPTVSRLHAETDSVIRLYGKMYQLRPGKKKRWRRATLFSDCCSCFYFDSWARDFLGRFDWSAGHTVAHVLAILCIIRPMNVPLGCRQDGPNGHLRSSDCGKVCLSLMCAQRGIQ